MLVSLRRSLPSISLLLALLAGVGLLAARETGLPIAFVPVAALVVLAVQFAIAPWLIEGLVRHTWVGAGDDYPVVAIVERQARVAGVPTPRIGIVDDGMPNAFTFGHVPRDARVFITRGLLERLDEAELEAVIAHELGHVRHFDVALMTLASAVPLALYWLHLVLRRGPSQTKVVALISYLAYVASQLCVLAFARSRETAADLWSCTATGDGEALASALVKVGYGIGQVRSAEAEQAQALVARGKEGKKQAAELARVRARTGALRAMGVFDPKASDGLAVAIGRGANPAVALDALRWDVYNPWGRTLELLSSHPLVARRIATLERSGLPGAPTTWSVLQAAVAPSAEEQRRLRSRWLGELSVAVGPWLLLAIAATGTAVVGSGTLLGLVLLTAGLGLLAKQGVRYPRSKPAATDVATLLSVLEAGPMAGFPVELHGRIVGRAMPGYVLSADLALQDDSGVLALRYRQPVPFARLLKALTGTEALIGAPVVATGWYRRGPAPTLELHRLVVGGSVVTRTWWWAACYACSAALAVAGLVVLALSAAG